MVERGTKKPEAARSKEVTAENAPFAVRAEGGEWVPVTHEADVRFIEVIADRVRPALYAAGESTFLLTGASSVLAHQALSQDSGPRIDLPVIDILVGRSDGINLLKIGGFFASSPFGGDVIPTPTGLELKPSEEEDTPLIKVSDRWEIILPPDEEDHYSISINLPTDQPDLFGHFTSVEIQDKRPEATADGRPIFIELSSPYLTRMMAVASARPEDRRILEKLAQMGYYEGEPTLLPGPTATEKAESFLNHLPRSQRNEFRLLDELRERVEDSVEIHPTAKYYASLRENPALAEVALILINSGIKPGEWPINVDKLPTSESLPPRDYRLVPPEMRSAQEHNQYSAEQWVETAESYPGGKEKFWLDHLTRSVKQFMKTQYIATEQHIGFVDSMRMDLEYTWAQPEHAVNAVVSTTKMLDAITTTAPDLISPRESNTIKAAVAVKDAIQVHDLVEEDITVDGETIKRIKRQKRTGNKRGDSEFESARVYREFASFVNGLYEEPIFDEQLGVDCIMASVADNQSDQTIFANDKKRAVIQTFLLTDFFRGGEFPPQGLMFGDLLTDAWAEIWSEEVEVKAAERSYHLEKQEDSDVIQVHNSKLDSAEAERLASITKAALEQKVTLINQKVAARSNASHKMPTDVEDYLQQTDPRIQRAVSGLLFGENMVTRIGAEDMQVYYEEMQGKDFMGLLSERMRVLGRWRPQDNFEETHTLPDLLRDQFPLYLIPRAFPVIEDIAATEAKIAQIQDREFFLLPGDIKTEKEQEQLMENRMFVDQLIPDWLREHEGHQALVSASVTFMAHALESVDRNYGRHGTTNVGERFLKNPFGEHSLPTFYHNGDGTHDSLSGTAWYMNYVNEQDVDSPYWDPEVYLSELMAAAVDDLIFDFGREEDENRTAALSEKMLALPDWSYEFPQWMIKGTGDKVKASIFDEATGKHQGGAGEASLAGDLMVLRYMTSSTRAMRLAVEQLWKPPQGAADDYEQILRIEAERVGFVGETFEEFLEFMGRYPEICQRVGTYLIKNAEKFVDPDDGYQFSDQRLNELFYASRKENALLQKKVGQMILDDVPPLEAFGRAEQGFVPMLQETGHMDTHGNIPQREYVLLPFDEHSEEERERIGENREFFAGLLPQWETTDRDLQLHFAAKTLMSYVLTSVERNNSVIDRDSLIGRALDMHTDVFQHGEQSPYYNEVRYLTELIAAGSLNLIPENKQPSALLVSRIMSGISWGFPFSEATVEGRPMISEVVASITSDETEDEE